MRIIGGESGGRRLKSPPGSGVRPTSDRVRESLFNILQQDIDGARFLDLYAGSGAVGIEALSRGAAGVIFVEQHQGRAAAIQKFLRDLGWSDRGRVVKKEARSYLETTDDRFDILFSDPPYESDELNWFRRNFEDLEILAASGIVVMEHPSSKMKVFSMLGPCEARQYRYGDTCLSVYRFEKG